MLELQYSDPRDSKLYTEPGADPEYDGLIYKLYVGGGEYYYCRPYKPEIYYQQMQRGIKRGKLFVCFYADFLYGQV